MGDQPARLSEIIAPAFYSVHWDLVDGGHTYYDLFGGRGSTKSSFIGVEIPLGMMQDPEANAIVFRKVASTLGTSVFEQCLWGIEMLGALDQWKVATSPYKLTYKPTGQVILFRGLDRAKKMKSVKVAHGYFKYLWFEELDEFFDDADDLKQTNPRAYQHEYLGDPVGTGGEVFENVVVRAIPGEERSHFDNIFMGIDWGWYPDPFAWVKVHYDSTRKKLYIYDEYVVHKQSNTETWNSLVMLKGVTNQDLITADSAEPKSVADYREYGAFCRPAVKGPDSVRYGVKWLQSLNEIIIDPETAPEAAREFTTYEYERTDSGEVMSGYPDANNHTIDATRYAMERIWRRKGQ